MATFNGDNNNNTISGSISADIINGLGGDDTLYGDAGDDTLDGGAGIDNLYGQDGNDTLIGGIGNDYLDGGLGADTYVISKADGQDVISNYDTDSSVDTIKFTDLASTGVTAIFQASNDLVIQYGVGGQLTLSYFFSSVDYRVDKFQFTDVTWTLADIAQRHSGTANADYLSGFIGMVNTINGLAGNDSISGVELADTLNGGDGDDNVYGYAGDDTLTGGAGNDYLVGDVGADTYVISKADGQDVIYNYDTDSSVDTIKFTDLASIGVTAVSQINGSDLVIQYGVGGQLTLTNFFYGSDYRVDKFQFTDVTWTLADIAQRHFGTALADNLYGFNGMTNTINGLAGDDYIYGGDLADTLTGGAVISQHLSGQKVKRLFYMFQNSLVTLSH
jgi:Ca2+-binding RTX toxin-like protein